MNKSINSMHYPFAVDQGLGAWMQEHDYGKHVEQLMMQVLFTNPGERINLPDFGCGIRQMVFAPNSDVTANLVQVMIQQALTTWLPTLITVIDVKATANDDKLEINIVYLIIAIQQRTYLNIEVTL
jgi:phage baseplate assembly protein W